MAEEEALLPYQAYSGLRHGHARRRTTGKATLTYQSWLSMKGEGNHRRRQ